jgi:hypothetical protein
MNIIKKGNRARREDTNGCACDLCYEGTEVKLALVELFPGAAFYGSQVLLTDSDSELILSTIGRLLGSPHVRLYTHVSLHATL